MRQRLEKIIKRNPKYLEKLRQDVTTFMNHCHGKLPADAVDTTRVLANIVTSSSHEDVMENPNLVHSIIAQYLRCQCNPIMMGEEIFSAHPGRLLLSPDLNRDAQNNEQLDMLFFSGTGAENIRRWQWQDVRLLIARQMAVTSKRARFIETEDNSVARLI